MMNDMRWLKNKKKIHFFLCMKTNEIYYKMKQPTYLWFFLWKILFMLIVVAILLLFYTIILWDGILIFIFIFFFCCSLWFFSHVFFFLETLCMRIFHGLTEAEVYFDLIHIFFVVVHLYCLRFSKRAFIVCLNVTHKYHRYKQIPKTIQLNKINILLFIKFTVRLIVRWKCMQCY